MKLSVIMAHRDAPVALATTLGDLGAQHRLPDEVVVVDDGSAAPLDSAKLCAALGARSTVDLAIVLRERQPGGAAAAHNVGLLHSRGDLIVWLAPGTRLSPLALARLEAAMAEIRADVAYARCLCPDEQTVHGEPFEARAFVASNPLRGIVVTRRDAMPQEGWTETLDAAPAAWDLWARLLLRDHRLAVFLPDVLSAEPPAQTSQAAAGDASALWRRWESWLAHTLLHEALGDTSATSASAASTPAPRFRPRPRILAVADVRGWAFDRNLRDMATYLPEFAWDFWFVSDARTASFPSGSSYDLLYLAYHRWDVLNGKYRRERAVSSLRSRWFRPEQIQKPRAAEFSFVNSWRRFHVVTQQNFAELRAHCPRLEYLTNPVNTRWIDAPTRIHNHVIASWNGNADHKSPGPGAVRPPGTVKGFTDFVRPACQAAGVPLVYAEYHTRRLTPGEMPEFYRQASVALCASLYEGASNSIMEAMAAGQALITTRVGNTEEIDASQRHYFGDSGIVFVPRDRAAIVDALVKLKQNPRRVAEMGRMNREEMVRRWSWEAWRDRYYTFFRRALDEAEAGEPCAASSQ